MGEFVEAEHPRAGDGKFSKSWASKKLSTPSRSVSAERLEEVRKAIESKHGAYSITIESGRKWSRIVKASKDNPSSGRSVYGFINMETGDLRAAKSWKSPMTDMSASTANVHNPRFLEHCGKHSLSHRSL